MQNTPPKILDTAKYLPILLDRHFPVHDPYLEHLHEPDPEPGQVLHYHDTLELGLCREGSGLFIIQHQTLPFGPGDLSVIIPGVPHIARSNRQDISRWHFIDIDVNQLFMLENPDIRLIEQQAFILRFTRPAGFSGIISRSRQSPRMAGLVMQLIQELKDRDAYALPAVRAIISLLFVEIVRYADRIQYNMPINRPDQKTVAEIMPAILYISRHYDQELTIPDLAGRCRMSVSAFRRRFHQVFALSPADYLYQVRIRMAKTLLRQNQLSITEIAGQVGYPTLSSFNRHFRKYVDQSPTEYQRAQIALFGQDIR
ncbi:MAG: AraC family transcriptional regulator [Clostridiaceae bacterium]|nr:AraC family transcriptional regulator [Clostridiaceae bacterium]